MSQTFEQFVTEQSVSLLRAAWTLTADRAAAEDLVQDALLVVYRKWRRCRQPKSPARAPAASSSTGSRTVARVGRRW